MLKLWELSRSGDQARITQLRPGRRQLTPDQLFLREELHHEFLDGVLDATTSDSFAQQFKALFSQKKARDASGVVYIWTTVRPIPRLSGRSPILYIGKTNTSLFRRHAQYANKEATNSNWHRYEHIIREYGPITVLYSQCSNPAACERSFLNEYFSVHLELPPLNSVYR